MHAASITAALRATLLGAVALIVFTQPGHAFDWGDELRGIPAEEEVAMLDGAGGDDPWAAMASLDVADEFVRETADPDDVLDAMVREERGEAGERPVRSSVRSVGEGDLDADGTVIDRSLPEEDLFGTARPSETFVPVLPRETSSVAVLPRSGWGMGEKRRSSVSTLASF